MPIPKRPLLSYSVYASRNQVVCRVNRTCTVYDPVAARMASRVFRRDRQPELADALVKASREARRLEAEAIADERDLITRVGEFSYAE